MFLSKYFSNRCWLSVDSRRRFHIGSNQRLWQWSPPKTLVTLIPIQALSRVPPRFPACTAALKTFLFGFRENLHLC